MAWYRQFWNLVRANRLERDLQKEAAFHVTERAEASILASRVLASISSAPFEIKGSTTPFSRTCSIGWASFPWIPSMPQAVSAEAVLSLADVALYRAKNGGRNRAVAALPLETGNPPKSSSAALPSAQFVELSGEGLIKL